MKHIAKIIVVIASFIAFIATSYQMRQAEENAQKAVHSSAVRSDKQSQVVSNECLQDNLGLEVTNASQNNQDVFDQGHPDRGSFAHRKVPFGYQDAQKDPDPTQSECLQQIDKLDKAENTRKHEE